MKTKNTIKAANALGNQILLLLLVGVGFVVMDVYRPGLFVASQPSARDGAVIFLTLNIYCYFRRLRKMIIASDEQLPRTSDAS